MPLNTLDQGQKPAVATRLVTGLTALGTNQATAYPLANHAAYEFTTVASGTGAVLPVPALPSEVAIFNAGASTLAIYPAGTGTINGGSAGAAISLGAATGITLWASSPSSWYTTSTGAAGSSSGTVTSVATGTGLTGGPVTTTGTVSIAAGGVGTTQLAANAVTYAKLQSEGASSLLGNPTGSGAVPSEITLGSGLSFSGTTLVASGGSGTVTSVVIGTGLASTQSPLTTTGTMSLATIPDKSVLGNTSGGTAAPAGVTLSAMIDEAIGSTQGDILYRDTAAWKVLAPGTSGQILSSQGAAANPQWITGAGGTGTVTSMSVVTANGVSGSVATATTTPAVTLTLGAITPTTIVASGAISGSNLSLGGTLTTAGALTTSGAYGVTLTATNTTSVTLPTSGTLVNTAVATLSSLTSVGTITTGTWNATPVTPTYGGTGLATLTAHAVMLGEGTSNVAFATIGTAGRLLIDQGSGADPAFEAMSGDATLASTGAITVAKIGGVGITLAGAFSTVGAYTVALTATNTTALTLPTSGTLATTAVATLSSLTSVGTIGTGVWQGTPVVPTYGGTGLATLTAHAVMLGEGTSNVGFATIGTTGRILADQGSGADPAFVTTGLQIDSHQGVITADTQSTGTWTCNLATSDWHTITLTQSITTLTLTSPSVGQQFTLVVIQGGSGSYTVAWFSTIKWPGGTAPTLTTTVGKADVFSFKCVSSGQYYGFIVGQNL